MKAVTFASRVITAVLAVATFALFFFGIVHLVGAQGTFNLSGYQMAFGTKVTSDSGVEVDFAKSAWFMFTMIFAAIAAICACASFKWKRSSVGGLVCGAVTTIMMLVFSFSNIKSYVDWRYVTKLTSISYTSLACVLTWCSIAFVVFSIITILVNDYAEVQESKGAKKVLFVRFIEFIREYKSEIKKISWPSLHTVVRNTAIVLIMCLIVGAFIWLVDWGLGNLIELIFA